MKSIAQPYALGHTSEEHRRLMLQSSLIGELTEALFARAGLAPGMKVLDVGCGAGDVSLLAAAFVGASGSVLGVDQADASVVLARERAEAAGLANLRFEVGRIEELPASGPFDALVGRLILLYLKDPAAVLRQLAPQVRPGGLIVFHEMDIPTYRSVPEVPLLTQSCQWIIGAFERVGVDPSMGTRLHSVFKAAGLGAPQLIGANRVEVGADSQVYQWVAQTVRSLLPLIVKTGVATEDEVGIDTLADRLRAQASQLEAVIHSPVYVGAWARR